MTNEGRNLDNEILKYISLEPRNILKRIEQSRLKNIEEIRMRVGRPLMLHNSKGDWFVENDGKLLQKAFDPFIVKQEDIMKTIELMSENSIYAFQEDIKNGFITLKGGHRIGITGRVVMDGTGIKNIKDFSGLNIRISREVYGCSDNVMRHIVRNKTSVYNTLLISPPQCGKTTLLRDITRNLSDGFPVLEFPGIKVGVIDERSEIAACYKGAPQNRVGTRTDVLDACPKVIGMDIMLRSMSPQVIITDEIGNQGDRNAITRVLNAGINIIASAHGYNISELKSRQEVIKLMEENVFERYIVLSNHDGPGTVEEIIDGKNMSVIYRRGMYVA
ncbi:MAG: stage III sporulation protein AA [Bacillota bacterium]|nr:stage III sporulation protein AA [Bacillota bacterium]